MEETKVQQIMMECLILDLVLLLCLLSARTIDRVTYMDSCRYLVVTLVEISTMFSIY